MLCLAVVTDGSAFFSLSNIDLTDSYRPRPLSPAQYTTNVGTTADYFGFPFYVISRRLAMKSAQYFMLYDLIMSLRADDVPLSKRKFRVDVTGGLWLDEVRNLLLTLLS